MTKSDFVRKMPNASAKEVVTAAAKQGMKLTDRYVYVIRSSDKRKGGGGPRGARGKRGARGGSHAGAEAALRRAIAEIGLGRARQVLNEVEHAFTG